MTEDHDTTGEPMDEDEIGGRHETDGSGADEGRELGSVFRARGSEEPDAERPRPSFDDILSQGEEDEIGEPEPEETTGPSHSDEAAAGASAWAAAGAALSGWAARIRKGVNGAIENARRPGDSPAGASLDAPTASPDPSDAADPDLALPTTGEVPVYGGAAAATDFRPPPEDDDAEPADLPPLPEDAAPAPEDLPADLPPAPEDHSRTGIPAPVEAAAGAGVAAATAASTGFDAALSEPAAPAAKRERPKKQQPVYGRDGRRLIDPTKPTLIFASIVTVVGAVWAVSTALAPVTDFDLAQSIANAKQSEQSAAQSGDSGAEAPAQDVVAPKISAVSVLSWSNDDGDHPDTAVNMIDGNPDTSWHSRWYDYNQFQDDSNVTIVIKLEKEATVSAITLQMDPSTSGGQLVVRNVTDPANPRGGTELMTTALSPTTEIALPQPVTTSSIALSFRQMPTSVDGNAWAWISELSVK